MTTTTATHARTRTPAAHTTHHHVAYVKTSRAYDTTDTTTTTARTRTRTEPGGFSDTKPTSVVGVGRALSPAGLLGTNSAGVAVARGSREESP